MVSWQTQGAVARATECAAWSEQTARACTYSIATQPVARMSAATCGIYCRKDSPGASLIRLHCFRSSPRRRGPRAKRADGKTGSPLSWGRTVRGPAQERRGTHSSYSVVKQPTLSGPRFGRAWGWPVSFPSPQMRGVARREGAWPGFRQTGPFFTGGPGTPGPWTPMTRASASSRRATRHCRFRVHG